MRDPSCSFCGKSRVQVKKLVAGPGVFICDQCIKLCSEILEQDTRPTPTGGTGRWTTVTSSSTGRRKGNLIGWLRNVFRSHAAHRT
jgi:hypothetical protein